ncbi:MAG: DinB/UmuC family translesion DNA polymerase [Chloroflexota bacterium]
MPPGAEAEFLAPLPVRRLWGVGPKTAVRLADLQIESIGDLAAADPRRLAEAVGRHSALALREYARGVDHGKVEPVRDTRSISEETTFPRDARDARLLWRVLREQCDGCADRLSAEGCLARTVTLKLRYGDFRTVTRSLSLAIPTDDRLFFQAAVAALMRRAWAGDRRPLRLVGVKLSGFAPLPALRQLPLFPPDVWS